MSKGKNKKIKKTKKNKNFHASLFMKEGHDYHV